MRESDFAFANQVRAAAELRTPRTSRMLLAAVILLLIAGTTWAHFAILDEVKRGQGRVIPSRQMQVLQSLEGGLVEAITVQEGDTVQKGQVLARIDNTKFSADLGEIRAKREAAANSLKLLSREVELTRKLYEQKVVPEIEMLRLQRQASDLSGQIAVFDETIKSAEDRVRRTEMRSPVYGIINKINVTTVGAVVQPGANLMDIVPLDDTLLVKGRLRPQDIAFIRYTVKNISPEGKSWTDAYLGFAMDADIGDPTNDLTGCFKDLNIGFTYSSANLTSLEKGLAHPPGYVGIKYLQGPAKDPVTGVAKMTTFVKWASELNPNTDDMRYDLMASGIYDSVDNEPADKRMLIASGPFNLAYGDSVQFVVAIVFAWPEWYSNPSIKGKRPRV